MQTPSLDGSHLEMESANVLATCRVPHEANRAGLRHDDVVERDEAPEPVEEEGGREKGAFAGFLVRNITTSMPCVLCECKNFVCCGAREIKKANEEIGEFSLSVQLARTCRG